ncbi:RNA polymerase sigma-70 factor [Tenacibaculum sp. 190524A02b]|uniref:RNA polymerase sigma-70 factor, ECF subfamily n=1 Tax=Tenacibaculum vairaonense TaxID=3137860 RepID=A0ABM9PS35_9FLAO
MKNSLNITLNLLKENDAYAFEQLYSNYYERLCIYLLNFTSDKAIIEDIVQDTFVTLWTRRHFITINTSLKSYLYKTAYHKYIDTFRHKKRIDQALLNYYNDAIIEVLEIDESRQKEQIKQLDRCINKLPLKCKTVFINNKIAGKKYKEVANELGIATKTVERHISRAFAFLKDCIKITS